MLSVGARSLLRLVGNAGSLLASEVLNKATTFLLYAFVARLLDVDSFGHLSLGLMLFYVFQVFASAGLPILLTREIAKEKSNTARLVTTGLAAAGLAALISSLAMALVTVIMQYDREATQVILCLALGLVPYALANVLEASFRGNERMHLIALSNVLANGVKVVGGIWLLVGGFGVVAIAGLIVAIRLLILGTDLFFYFRNTQGGLTWFRYAEVKKLLVRAIPFLGVDAVIACWSAVDVVLLSKLMSPAEVALYSASAQLIQPVTLVYRSIVGSIFPAMCRKAKSQNLSLSELTRWMVAFLLLIGLPVSLLIPRFADLLLELAYSKPEFQGAVPVMQIAALAVLTQCFTTILGHALWAADREADTLRIVIINLCVNVIVNSLMISRFGLVGAAAGSFLVSCFNVAQHVIACRSAMGALPVDWQILNPVLAGIAMVLVVYGAPSNNRFLVAICGVAAYASVAMGLIFMRHGGMRELRSKFFAPLLN
ncbi:MAG: oligosaccharide flippase family protein [Planctomycetales bacterium]|nr:oligosaccharide flippase family protein [Planctomycetales bacterium]